MPSTPDASAPVHRSFAQRIVGALLLDASVFEEVEEDRGALVGASVVVVVAGLARGIGAQSSTPAMEILGSAITGVLAWFAMGALIWGIGVKRMGYTSSYPELLRTIGFAAAPLFLLTALLLPLGPAHNLVWTVAHAWALLSLLVAIREALDVGNTPAFVVCLLALLTAVFVVSGLGSAFLMAFPAD